MDFSQISILIVAAGLFGLFAKLFKQPLLVGYLFAGIFLAGSGILKDTESLKGLAQIGVALLLFLMGMELNTSQAPSIGKAAFLAGALQVLVTSILGFLISATLDFSLLSSLYIAAALTFSSTIIVVKLLGFFSGTAEIFLQSGNAHSVNDAEIYHFCPAAHFVINFFDRHAKHKGSHSRMNIFPIPENLRHFFVS